MEPIKFDRKPYTIAYYKDGERHTIRRVPPPLQHKMLPTDKVELSRQKNDDWKNGDTYTVKHINPRHPNVIQIQDRGGNATFVPYYDLKLNEEVAPRDGILPMDRPSRNKYLLWP